ncbi:MAG: hypothetical protein ACI8S6_004350, partial [Myxococcota bacterium]
MSSPTTSTRCAINNRRREVTVADWNALKHSKLRPLAENLWTIEGALPNMGLPRTCTVIRRDDGSILLHSVIALDDEGMAALADLGPLTAIIVPNA